jgi:TRAP-type C4-dicarboxylate transport system permease small subunit
MDAHREPSTLLKKSLGFLGKAEEFFLMTCFSVIGLVLFFQVLLRYCLDYPLTWSEELARYLLVWITFFGINYGIRRHKHIEMEYFFNKLPERLQTGIALLTNIMILLMMWKIFGSTLRFVSAQMRIGSSAMQISMGIVYIAIPLGFLTSSISILMNAYTLTRRAVLKRNS